ncbi:MULTISPECIES: cytosine deaminase [Sporolactobacillus]|uniref:Cytosine deaminase n=1 Tax=Sporolactobacillus nakayamae TaxID=269670 RepID=A0A1I2QYR8_9BACL|nr:MULTISPECIES: cytosine deaminase [Sporolactobacillus]MCQ2009810.1 cytosine deaminase [Sporolactobacillus sp. STSJ-5]SFG33554.1 cytosine deaminase [Sporolactobacillus nakayamae]
MLIRNARLVNREGLWNIRIDKKMIDKIEKASEHKPQEFDGEASIDAKGDLVIPPFIEPHVHLDTVLTAGDPKWNLSGTLFEGIETWTLRKAKLTRDDVLSRAKKALMWQAAQGIQFVRTHVDVDDPNLTALKALIDLKEAVSDWMDIQIVAFPQESILGYPKGKELVAEAILLGADAVGGIPHYELTREDGVASMGYVFDLAEKYDRLIDVHCDEIDDEQSRFIEVIAAEAYKRGMGDRVTASHTTAMHSYNGAYTAKLFRLLKRSGIHFVSNPLVNTHLQGRFDTYPKRRGVTRVPELLQAGINVCFGHDDIFDPWYPLGTGNMLQVLFMGLHVCQLMGYEQITHGLDLITTNSAKALHVLDQYGIEEGKPANMLIMSEQSSYDVIRKLSPVRYSIHEGKVLSETIPSKTFLNLDEKSLPIHFK